MNTQPQQTKLPKKADMRIRSMLLRRYLGGVRMPRIFLSGVVVAAVFVFIFVGVADQPQNPQLSSEVSKVAAARANFKAAEAKYTPQTKRVSKERPMRPMFAQRTIQ